MAIFIALIHHTSHVCWLNAFISVLFSFFSPPLFSALFFLYTPPLSSSPLCAGHHHLHTPPLLPVCLLSSAQHVDIAALLIKYNTCVNATDKWAFTPLHEAAQKGRTQLCALLLAHGADPTMKNQEGQTPLDLATVQKAL